MLPSDNAMQASDESEVDAEWFTVQKEQYLAEKCRVVHGDAEKNIGPNFFWTVFSQNGNAPERLGSESACYPQCYVDVDGLGYPPAVNASSSRCPVGDFTTPILKDAAKKVSLGFNDLPMNSGKTMIKYTDPADPQLRGGFNWTFELDEDLAVAEADFPATSSLGILEWSADKAGKGLVRVYQRVSEKYSWICTYFGADSGVGIKGNQAYDGRGIMTEKAFATLDGPIVRFFLNITKYSMYGAGSFYAPNMEACWDQKTGKACTPYGDTNTMVHNQVLLDYDPEPCGDVTNSLNCPRYHRYRNGTLVHKSDERFPFGAYKQYCGPCTSCDEMQPEEPCCDRFSNSNGQSIYKLNPHEEWAHWGLPASADEGWMGDERMHEINVGGVFSQIFFPCKNTEPMEIVSINIGPETLTAGDGTRDTEFFVSDFDILMPNVTN